VISKAKNSPIIFFICCVLFTDGITRMGSTATGLGAVFNDRKQDRFGFDADDDDQW